MQGEPCNQLGGVSACVCFLAPGGLPWQAFNLSNLISEMWIVAICSAISEPKEILQVVQQNVAA